MLWPVGNEGFNYSYAVLKIRRNITRVIYIFLYLEMYVIFFCLIHNLVAQFVLEFPFVLYTVFIVKCTLVRFQSAPRVTRKLSRTYGSNHMHSSKMFMVTVVELCSAWHCYCRLLKGNSARERRVSGSMQHNWLLFNSCMFLSKSTNIKPRAQYFKGRWKTVMYNLLTFFRFCGIPQVFQFFTISCKMTLVDSS
jgi:hypothetical protein